METLSWNLWAVLAATLCGMVLGAFWYSPIAFGKQWMQCIGKTEAELGSATVPMLGSIIANFLMALGVNLILSLCGISESTDALWLGLGLGLLIIFPAMLSDNLFCGWGLRLLAIQSAYRALSVTLMSFIIALVA